MAEPLANVLENVEQELKNNPHGPNMGTRVEPLEKFIPSKYRSEAVTWETLQQEGRKLATEMEAHRQRCLEFLNNHHRTAIDEFKRIFGG